MIRILFFTLICVGADIGAPCSTAAGGSRFHVLAISEDAGHHALFSKAAKVWLNKLAVDSSFSIDYVKNIEQIDEVFLSHYQVILQLDYPPYRWSDEAKLAFQNYIRQGKGGWIGLHHASLLGEFDGYAMWEWFSEFLGGIRYKNYIPEFASARVNIEDATHPVTHGVPRSFTVKEEWYTYNFSPRPHVHVIASVDESTYSPDSKIKMGDHPVVWTNYSYPARNVYIFMGHSPELFQSEAYTTMLRNAIFWAAGR